MSQVRVFKVESSLSKLMKKPGGRTVGEALSSAQARVEKIRAQSIERMAEAAARLRQLAVQGRTGDCAAVEALYAGANGIFALAGHFDMRALSEAAFSLCDLLTAADLGVDVDWMAVDVHVEAIRLLSHPDPKVDAAQLIAGLRAVRARYAPVGETPVKGRA